jgi:transposase InsO family protein
MAYEFMKSNQNEYTIKEMAELFGVSRSAYYRWAKNGVCERRAKADMELIRLIRKIVKRHHRRYGSPRVRQELRLVYGIRVSLKKVARLMRENNLNARRRRRFIPTTDSKHTFEVNENILNRDFHAEKGGQKWVSDITYLRTIGGWVFLTVIIDLFDRKVIGWALSNSLEAICTTIPALAMAVKNRTPHEGLIFHSDRGVQYCAKSFRSLLHELCPTVHQSMSRKGNCWDNACAESFFKTLKVELETLEGKHSEAEVRQSVFYYIEAYYNQVRLHSVLDYVAPNVFILGEAA